MGDFDKLSVEETAKKLETDSASVSPRRPCERSSVNLVVGPAGTENLRTDIHVW